MKLNNNNEMNLNNNNEFNTVDLLIEKFHSKGISTSVNKDKDNKDKDNIDLIANNDIEIQDKTIPSNENELIEYRVKVLTRIGTSLPKAFKETMKVCKANQKCLVLTALFDLINNSHQYLGKYNLILYIY
jgi:hypothetical protein